MAEKEPSLFPNQPNPEEHVKQHSSGKPSPYQQQPLQLNDVATRLKVLEERYSMIRKKTQFAEHNIINLEKETSQELRLINDDILDVKKDLKEVREKLSLLVDEIEHFTPLNDFRPIAKYVEFWNPMDFVTRKEVNDFLRKKFKELK